MSDWPESVRNLEEWFCKADHQMYPPRGPVLKAIADLKEYAEAEVCLKNFYKAEVERLRGAICSRCTVSSPDLCDECEYAQRKEDDDVG